MNPSKIRIATIKKIINGGYGLCRDENGKTMLVRHCLPGETVEIQIVEEQQNLDYGITTAVEVSHRNRITPPCPWYSACGGCDLQHTDYPSQCAVKEDILKDLLERNQRGALRDLIPLLAPVLPSPGEFGYRQRIRLKTVKNTIGFNRFRS